MTNSKSPVRDFDEAIEDQLVRKYKRLARPRREPVYPSARVTVEPARYMEAVEALREVPSVLCDGHMFLVPGAERSAIELLRSEFGAAIEYGHGHPDHDD